MGDGAAPTGGRALPRLPRASSLILPPALERLLLLPLRVGLVLARETRTLGSIAVLVTDDRKVLCVRMWYRSAWGLPGGYLKRRETPQQAGRREVREEVGLEVDEWPATPAVVFQARRRHVDFVFLLEASPAQVAAVRPISREITAAAWFDLSQLPDLQPEALTALQAVGLL